MKDLFCDSTLKSQGCFSTVNVSYLEHPDAFKINHVVRDWPQAKSLFTQRIADRLSLGSSAVRVTPSTFMELAEALTSKQPGRIFTFRVRIEPTWDIQKFLIATLIDASDRREPPIMADNAGFFEYAMDCFANRAIVPSTMTLSITSNALFWFH